MTEPNKAADTKTPSTPAQGPGPQGQQQPSPHDASQPTPQATGMAPGKRSPAQMEADLRAREGAQAVKDAAAQGAQSVRDAVAKVADAAVAEIQKQKSGPQGDFTFEGSPNGTFSIRGNGFSSGGTVLIGGQQAYTNEWGGQFITGRMPANVKSGSSVFVEVIVDQDTRQSGTYRV